MGGRGSSSMGSGGFRSTGDPVKDLERLGFKVKTGFSGLEGEYQSQVVEQLARLESEFGVVGKYGGAITAENLSATLNAYVGGVYYSDPAHNQVLTFNSTHTAADRDMRSKMNANWNYYMPYDQGKYTGVQRTATHEYGHMLQHVIIYNSGALDVKSHNSAAAAHKREILSIARKQYGLPKGALKFGQDSISEYGMKNTSEFFAEAFANSQLGSPNPIGLAMRDFLARKKAQGLY